MEVGRRAKQYSWVGKIMISSPGRVTWGRAEFRGVSQCLGLMLLGTFSFSWDHVDYWEVSSGIAVSWLIVRHRVNINSDVMWAFWSLLLGSIK